MYRGRVYVDLPFAMKLSVSGLFTSKYNSDAQYEYKNQRLQSVLGGTNGVLVAPNNERVIVNFKLSKTIVTDKLNVYVFGNDILNAGRIENTSGISAATLSQTKNMFGIGGELKF
jgi:hypothetical protein